jgi:hypothetical protein
MISIFYCKVHLIYGNVILITREILHKYEQEDKISMIICEILYWTLNLACVKLNWLGAQSVKVVDCAS